MKMCLFNWMAVIFWMTVIYFFSDQPNLQSSFPSFWDMIFRKLAHIAEFFVLTFLLVRALQCQIRSFVIIIFFSGMLSLIFAISDEFHQTFVSGRHGSFSDVVIDSFGIALFFLMWFFEDMRRKRVPSSHCTKKE